MEYIWISVACAASIGVCIRFSSFIRAQKEWKTPTVELPAITIVIPVRNEATSIARILNSLLELQYPSLEIIVVDDDSTDNTKNIASRFPVKIVSAPLRPEGWIGKSWACHIGALAATGEYILFTDSDTIHKPDGLHRAISFLTKTNSKLISTTGYYANELWWEKMLGPFYCMMYAGASPYDEVSEEHPYALGLYLLIDKSFYLHIGGHAAIRNSLADDASLARQVMLHGGVYSVYQGKPLCEVQMYRSLSEFVNGWVRIFRLGMNELKPSTIVYTFLPLLAMNIPALGSFTMIGWLPTIVTLTCFAIMQSQLGRFNLSGILLFPIPILFFVGLASWAYLCHVVKAPISWRGRKYLLQPNGELSF